MRIGIIGSGNVGGALGKRWKEKGHSVKFGSRHPESAEMKALAGPDAATLPDTVQASDILLLSTPWPATKDILSSLGDLKGKILIDAVNPVTAKLDGLDLGTTTSASEQIAQWAPGAKVVKCFNTVGSNVMENSTFPEGKVVMFYCGDDTGAKGTVQQLATELGFNPIDIGPLKQARLLEPFALLWITNALVRGREIAFQFMTR